MEKYDVIVDEYGTICFYKPGTLIIHRLDGPAVEFTDGTKYWYVDGKIHRIDGPAAEYADGSKFWYVDGKRHRIDGPAVEWAYGDKWWFINGVNLTEDEFKKKTAPVKELTVAEIEKLLGHKIKIVK